MNKNRFLGLIFIILTPAVTEAGTSLGLTSADLDRLGVELQPAERVIEVEVASGPATVVIPPTQEVIVTSSVSGVLSRLLVAEGESVFSGQPLAEIMSADLLQLQREFIQAALTNDLARAQADRDRGLYQDGIIAERRMLESAAAQRTAAAALDQVRQQLMLAGMRPAELARLLETQELSPALELKSPIAATVIEQHAALGAQIDALEPVYRVADLSKLWLELHVPHERAMRIRPGMRIAVPTAESEVTGEVSLIGRVTDEASQTVLVRARIADEHRALSAGQVLPARVLDEGGEESSTLTVPNAAIVRSDGRTYVFAVQNGELAVVPVHLLGENATQTYISGNLEAGVRIAVSGTATLKSVWLSAQDEGE